MTGTCCTPTLNGLISFEEALELLLSRAEPPAASETAPLREAAGRVLAAPVVSAIDVPGWDNSAMDGYALRAADVPAPGTGLRVSQRVPAGTAPTPLEPGTAARIFTGAPVPEGADTVVMQEQCRQEGERVVIEGEVTPGSHIRRAGEDIRRGARVLEPGTLLQPQHIGLAASVGVAELVVRPRLRVALFATGDELVLPGEPLPPGAIYNSNLFTAGALLRGWGCEVIELGQVEDSLEATRRALAEGAGRADLIVASGGVSVGEEDYVKPAVEALGSLEMWKLAIRPGKPVAFGRIGEAAFFGSPGNPVSLFVTLLLLARPYILRRQGRSDPLPRPLQLPAGFDWPRPDRRREFHRARLERDAHGELRVIPHPSRSSAVLSSVVWAEGLVVLPEGRPLQAGDPVDFLPFSELLT